MRNTNINRQRPVVHATQSMGELLPQKFLAEVKARKQAAHERFVHLEELWKTALQGLRNRGSHVPREWMKQSWPMIRTAAGTTGEFDASFYREACMTLEWGAVSPEHFREAREFLGVR